MDRPREAEIHRLVGEALCLDYANTLNGHNRLPNHEYLQDYRDMVLWGRHAGVLSQADVEELLSGLGKNSVSSDSEYLIGLEIREVIFRIFSARANGKDASAHDLDSLGRAWRSGQEHAQLVRTSDGFTIGWDDAPSLEGLFRTVIASAVNLLTSADLTRVRMCAGEHCDWLFVDNSRNHLRRWCSMDECGNRAKMQRRRGRRNIIPAGNSV